MTRIRAFLLHLGFSLLAVGLTLAVILFLWYPGPFFKVVGASDVVSILVLVCLVVGPLLTLILFRPGKWGLKFDMAAIVSLQIAALCVGSYLVYQERPYYAVFVVDRFEVLARQDVDESRINDEMFRDKPWGQPIYAVAALPADPQERQRILEETVFEGKPDIHQRPEYWQSYVENSASISRGIRPLDELLRRHPGKARDIKAARENYGPEVDIAYVPVSVRTRSSTLLIDRRTLKPVGMLELDPWARSEPQNLHANF